MVRPDLWRRVAAARGRYHHPFKEATMSKSPRMWGMMLLAISLVVWGVAQFGLINVQAGGFDVHKLAACLAVGSGALLLMNR